MGGWEAAARVIGEILEERGGDNVISCYPP